MLKFFKDKKRRRKRQGIVGPHKSDLFNKGLCVGLQRQAPELENIKADNTSSDFAWISAIIVARKS